MSRLTILRKYFPTGTAEGEVQLLDKVFVTPKQMDEVLGAPEGSPAVLLGRKGVGKTALMEWLRAEFSKCSIPAILIRPDDIDTTEFRSADDIGSLKGAIHRSLVHSVAAKIGGELQGMLKGAQAKLYEEAVKAGTREPSFLRKTIEILKLFVKPASNIEVADLAKKINGKTTPANLSSAIKKHLNENGAGFYLFVDDTDQIASPNDPNHLNRIWAFILAIRKLAQECPGVRCIVSLRTEVWLRLTKNDRGQRDQIDHIRPLLVTMRGSSDHIMQIVMKRLVAASVEAGEPSDRPFEAFFGQSTVRLPTSDERRSWSTFLVKSSRERPRDVIQLVGHLIAKATKRGGLYISDEDVEVAMKDYSKERAQDLGVEFGEICNNLSEVIRLFSGHPFEWKFEDLRIFLRNVPSSFGVRVYAKTLQQGSDDDAMALLSMLHEADFLNAKTKDPAKSRGFDHISFLDEPHLVQKDRWNELQNYLWEVHPVFRSYLISIESPIKAHLRKTRRN